ncbi:MAG: A/G-specific adenine glycosylase [Bacteroidales bacterium]|nr:A/G-specific adenine glycosylase [Bacteroidales bacterium]MCL2132783.1 A/G-specific adenine glycosylase [Bacteroidales bacterium]
MPWKGTADPYKIWLSEIILQQTRVEQGYDYYLRFVQQYPTVKVLAAAPIDEVLKLWQGLGYYSRARNLHYTAQIIANEFKGKFPTSYKSLLNLKGVGEYTAAAIASFAYNEAVVAIDGNGYRILSRFFGVETPIDTTTGKKEIYALVEELLPRKEAGRFNQALMDFGSLVCTPKNTQCAACPLSEACFAFNHAKVAALPIKSKKVAVRSRYFHYFIVSDGHYTYLHKRSANDIWKGLYEFPLIETTAPTEVDHIIEQQLFKSLFGKYAPKITAYSQVIKHQLTHQRLWTRFYAIKLDAMPKRLAKDFCKVPIAQIETYSIPRLIDAFLEKKAGQFLFQKKCLP